MGQERRPAVRSPGVKDSDSWGSVQNASSALLRKVKVSVLDLSEQGACVTAQVVCLWC